MAVGAGARPRKGGGMNYLYLILFVFYSLYLIFCAWMCARTVYLGRIERLEERLAIHRLLSSKPSDTTSPPNSNRRARILQ
jgi:hypothetical protein